jgi:hypothetical protein
LWLGYEARILDYENLEIQALPRCSALDIGEKGVA